MFSGLIRLLFELSMLSCFVNVFWSLCAGLCPTSIPCGLSNLVISEILLMYGKVVHFVLVLVLFCCDVLVDFPSLVLFDEAFGVVVFAKGFIEVLTFSLFGFCDVAMSFYLGSLLCVGLDGWCCSLTLGPCLFSFCILGLVLHLLLF